jgi:phospholipid/cholesterol/gamma-HCH transport system substrate-binding protein
MLQQLEQALTRANSAVAEYEALAVSTRGIIEGDGREAVANINAAAEEARTAVASINRIATGAEGPVNEFVTTGLPQMQQAIQGLDEATRSLEGLIDEVRSSPRDFIGRAPSKEMEVQP